MNDNQPIENYSVKAVDATSASQAKVWIEGFLQGLIGENGAGKTTTIKCILNLIRRDSGTITILGKDNVADERAAKLEVGVVLDECFFHDSLRPTDLKRILGPVYPILADNLYADSRKKVKSP